MPIASNIKQCQHINVDGTRCGSPAIKGAPGCYFHVDSVRRIGQFVLPRLEDPNSVQFSIMEVMRALLDKRIDRPTANTLLYALQIAHSNLGNMYKAAVEEDNEEERGNLVDFLLKRLDAESAQAAEDAKNGKPAPDPDKTATTQYGP
jgi:hypothetical protein